MTMRYFRVTLWEKISYKYFGTTKMEISNMFLEWWKCIICYISLVFVI